MKIVDYKTYAVNASYRNLIFVKVFTDEGVYGVGEATIEWKTNATLGALEDIRPYVIGADPTRIEQMFFECFRQTYWHTDPCTLSAIAAIEMACVDITGKIYNVPAYQLFGGKVFDRVKIYVNGWSARARTPDEFAVAAADAVQKGAKALKWDFFGKSWITITHEAMDRAVNSLAAVREAVGPNIDLLIEAHGRFNVHTALKIADELAPYKPMFMEEPVFTDVVQDTIEFHKCSPVPTAAGERLFGKTMFRELIDRNGADYVQPDLLHCGGMSELKKIGIMAEVHGIQIAPHNPNGPVATAAAMHVCATLPNFEFLEMMNDAPHRGEVSNERLTIEDGYLTAPETPGLGVDIDEEACKKYPAEVTPQILFSGAF
ncbi:MAG: mandelate racemase/muconate lactonizing enzyme family protein [Oscillospiraceae bacterium]|jgi:galactonate dehydratase|nr:mandelate racemase/muconate lactonizing enzyme family protein [Oscillospiraceae bacterium]